MNAPDTTLLQRWITRRDAEAFDEIVSRHAGLVHGVSRRILGNDADAEDVAQDCFLRLARATSPPHSSLAGWLHAVAVRRSVDLSRARTRRLRRERRFAESRSGNGAGASDWAALEEHVDTCIAALPDELRDVIVAHFLHRRTHDEIAAELGVSRQTVSRRSRLGVERLRRLLARRGVVASVAALTASLVGLPARAAPPALLASLGRMALSGSASAGPASAGSALMVNVGGFVMAKKLLISVAAALVLFLGGLLVIQAPWFAAPDEPGASLPAGDQPEERATTPAVAVVPGGATLTGHDGDGSTAAVDGAVADVGGAVVTGAVVDLDGRAVARATVVAAAGPPEEKEKLTALVETTSDAEGRFTIRGVGLPAGASELVVAAFESQQGLGAVTISRDAIEETPDRSAAGLEVDIVVEPLCEVGGRVSDQGTGEPIAGFPMLLRRSGLDDLPPGPSLLVHGAPRLFGALSPAKARTATDGDGRYSFVAIGPLQAQFGFEVATSEYVVPGFRGGDPAPAVDLAPGEHRTDLDFALERAGAISGTVRGPDGAPLPAARVELVASYVTRFGRLMSCDADGAYRFSGLMPRATYVVHAWHEGLAPGDSEIVAMSTAQEHEGVDVHLLEGATASGRLVDDLRMPIAGVRIALEKHFESRRTLGGFETPVTRDDGSFAFHRVAPGEYVLRPYSDVHVPRTFPLAMPETGDVVDLELRLPRRSGGFIAGHVVDDTGARAPGVTVVAWRRGRLLARTRSAEDGTFRLEGLEAPGGYTISAHSGDAWGRRVKEVELYTADLALTVLRRGRIVGRVVDAETGDPIDHFEIRTAFERPDGNRFHRTWSPFSSESGLFVIERAEPDPVRVELHVRSEGYVSAKSPLVSARPGGESELVEIQLERGASLRGAVVETDTREPIAGVRIRCHRREAFAPYLVDPARESWTGEDMWKPTMSHDDGRFEVTGFESGETVHLVAWKDGYGTVTRRDIEVAASGATIEIALPREATLVVDARFTPRPGEFHVVTALHREERPWPAAFRLSRSAPGPGAVELAGLPPGRFRLIVSRHTRRGGGTSAVLLGEEHVRLAAGERRKIVVDADELERRFASVSGTVTGAVDPTRVIVNVFSKRDGEESYTPGNVTCEADGRFYLAGLPAGEYVLVFVDTAASPRVERRVPLTVANRQRREIAVAFE